MRIICWVFGKMALDNSIKVRMLVDLRTDALLDMQDLRERERERERKRETERERE